MMRGELGQPPGGWPEAIQRKVLKGAEPITVRPGSLLAAADLDAERADGGGEDRPPRRATASSPPTSMYPKVFCGLRRRAGELRPDRGPADADLFLRPAAGEEISVELERGKTLVVRCQAIGEPDEDGAGARLLRAERPAAHRTRARPRARRRRRAPAARRRSPATRPMSPRRCRASSPAFRSRPARRSRAGDVLLSIEAMKMETALHADRDGTHRRGAGQGRRPDRREGFAYPAQELSWNAASPRLIGVVVKLVIILWVPHGAEMALA